MIPWYKTQKGIVYLAFCTVITAILLPKDILRLVGGSPAPMQAPLMHPGSPVSSLPLYDPSRPLLALPDVHTDAKGRATLADGSTAQITGIRTVSKTGYYEAMYEADGRPIPMKHKRKPMFGATGNHTHETYLRVEGYPTAAPVLLSLDDASRKWVKVHNAGWISPTKSVSKRMVEFMSTFIPKAKTIRLEYAIAPMAGALLVAETSPDGSTRSVVGSRLHLRKGNESLFASVDLPDPIRQALHEKKITAKIYTVDDEGNVEPTFGYDMLFQQLATPMDFGGSQDYFDRATRYSLPPMEMIIMTRTPMKRIRNVCLVIAPIQRVIFDGLPTKPVPSP